MTLKAGMYMSMFKVHCCAETNNMYLEYKDAKVVQSLDEVVDLFDYLSSDEDTVYIDVLDTKDVLIVNGDEVGKVFVEIDTAIGGVFSRTMEIAEMKGFLSNVHDWLKDPMKHGFEVSPY